MFDVLGFAVVAVEKLGSASASAALVQMLAAVFVGAVVVCMRTADAVGVALAGIAEPVGLGLGSLLQSSTL